MYELSGMCRTVQVLGDAILMIVERFSELILACKSKSSSIEFTMHLNCDAATTRKKSRPRFSSTVDREQQLVCYRELHSIQHTLHQSLDTNQVPLELASLLRQVHAALRPFKQPA